MPMAARMRRTASTCSAAPLCEAHITASSAGPRPKRAACPRSTSGSAWNGLQPERKYVSQSPAASRGGAAAGAASSALVTTAKTSWVASTVRESPRSTCTR